MNANTPTRQHAGTEQPDPDQIDVPAAPAAAPRQEPRGEHQRDQPDGDVDEEDPTPPFGAAGQRDDRAAEHGADRCGDPDGRAEEPEGTSTLGAAEQLLDQRRVLRRQHAGGDALREPGRDEHADRLRRAGQRAEQDEPGQRREEQPAAPNRPAGTSASPNVSA
jgi:hypothetical protein